MRGPPLPPSRGRALVKEPWLAPGLLSVGRIAYSGGAWPRAALLGPQFSAIGSIRGAVSRDRAHVIEHRDALQRTRLGDRLGE